MRREGVYSKMDVGSKEVLMESPPVSLIVCTCMCVCVYMCATEEAFKAVELTLKLQSASPAAEQKALHGRGLLPRKEMRGM